MKNFYEQAESNKRKSFLIVALFIAVVMAFSWAAYYLFDMSLGFVGLMMVFSGVMSFSSFYYSDRIILSLANAKPADRNLHFDFYTSAENLAMAAGLPKPRLYVIEDEAPNAFATGRDPKHAIVCVTTGLLAKLNRSELEGVVAHELAHVQNYDIRLMSIVTILVGFITMLTDIMIRSRIIGGSKSKDSNQLSSILMLISLLLIVLSPIFATLIKLAISRRREYLADATAVSLTKFPGGLKNALIIISSDPSEMKNMNHATAHLYISSPFKKSSSLNSLFSTHPPIEKRIAQLDAMS